MHSRSRNKDSLIFSLIGSIAGGITILIYDLASPPRVDPTPTPTLFSFPDPFFIGFGMIALSVGLFYATKRKVIESPRLNMLLMSVIFILCGLAYSFWLDRSQDPSSKTFTIPFAFWIVSFAVGLFVFIFCATFLALPDNRDAVIRSPLLALVVPVLFLLGIFLSFCGIISLGLVCCLLVLTLVYITIEYHLHEFFNNIIINVLSFILALSVFSTVGVILLPISLIYFLIAILPFKTSPQNKTKLNGPVLERRITTTFEWILALPSVLLNYTIIGSFLSVLPYLGIVKHLRITQQLTRANAVRSSLLGIVAFLVHMLFFVYYDSIRTTLSGTSGLLWGDVLVWSVVSFIGCGAIGYSLFGLENEA
jgi:hypothetical protein